MTDIDEDREVSVDEMFEYLTQDRGAVPCSRYGRDSNSCAPWAIAMQLIYWDANGSGDAPLSDSLHHLMGLVVNDHDDVLTLIADHGAAVEGDEVVVQMMADVLDEAESLLQEDIVRNLSDLQAHTLLRLRTLTADPAKCWETVRDLQ